MAQPPKTTDTMLEIEPAGVAKLTLNRDDVRNAVTGTTIVKDIVSVIDWINGNEDISVLVITGAGSAFSGGGNIKDMAARKGDFSGDVAELERIYRAGMQQLPLAMDRAEVPVIAAINGAAVGAGFDLALTADMRIASDRARFAASFVNLGIVPGDGGAWFLERVAGHQRAAELSFTGRMIDAAEALRIGLVLEVVEHDMLQERAMGLAREIASKPRGAIRRTKRLLKSAQRMELRDFLDLSAVFQAICHNSEEHMEAVAGFLNRGLR